MAMTVEKYIRLGEDNPTRGTAQQGDYSVPLYDKFKEALERVHFTEAMGADMKAQLAKVHAGAGTQKDTWDEAKSKTREQAVCIDDAKALYTKLGIVVPIMLEYTPVAGVSAADFQGTAELGRMTSRLVNYGDRIADRVKKIDEPLKPYFGGQSARALLEEVLEGLKAADSTQELSREAAPKATRELNEAKGRLLHLITQMNRLAKVAFWGDAQTIAMFNKDILLRARRSKTGSAEPGPVKTVA